MLAPGVIELFACDIRTIEAADSSLIEPLSDEERRQAERFRSAADRRRYRISRCLMRRALAHFTGVAPEALVFEQNAHGKPYLSAGPAFNVSHSRAFVIIGIVEEGDLGVDVEQVEAFENLETIAARYFSQAELAAFAALPAAERTRAFFRAWTRKEAFIKAVGKGLSIDLGSFSVSLVETSANAFLNAADEHRGAGAWTIKSVPIDASVEAAVALDRRIEDIRLRRVSPRLELPVGAS